MTSVSGLGYSSSAALTNIFASDASTTSSQGASSASSSDDGVNFDSNLSIAQIRDTVDTMATSGQLTTAQQRALIVSGFQDMNAYDPSYQPAAQTGLSRSDSDSVNMVSTLESQSAFAASAGNSQMAAVYSSLATMFSEKSTGNNVNVSL
jgi:hypothetical protein